MQYVRQKNKSELAETANAQLQKRNKKGPIQLAHGPHERV